VRVAGQQRANVKVTFWNYSRRKRKNAGNHWRRLHKKPKKHYWVFPKTFNYPPTRNPWQTVRSWRDRFGFPIRYLPNGQPYILRSEAITWAITYDNRRKERIAKKITTRHTPDIPLIYPYHIFSFPRLRDNLLKWKGRNVKNLEKNAANLQEVKPWNIAKLWSLRRAGYSKEFLRA